MAPKSPFRAFQLTSRTLRQSLFRQPVRRRITTAETTVEPPSNLNAFQRLWRSPIGPKTVHFWAPIFKWGVVLTGISDFARPAESLSLTQNLALMATGAIWTRWCFVIKPRNIFLASVNFLLFCVGATQVGRILSYHQSIKNSTFPEEAKKAAKHEGKIAEGIVKDPEGAVKKAEAPIKA
ncbi:hypothetical protein W97_05520 [Coniosporium apollinis CBS 100218]|uniref:Mitochondrial pyruvate carrier n=1 Tax=Coniosporium apollinis (strain CBS 100218) TaxID=1168221 RepID=R7YX54_CONA1|nr:uncharacterized protein W97_05520 [Coniosporium apollinis CBS 100218]EON66423.1 hypothetical protein W97_05520 [Coniosporium apollinis CBS 100218]